MVTSSTNNYMDIRDGVLVSYTGQAQSLTIPREVRIIGAYAFQGGQEGARNQHKNRYTEEVIIPSTVREIDTGAFLGCERLKRIVISEGLEVIGNGVFDGCRGLSEINFPNTLGHIGDYAFSKTSITSLSLPENTSHIGNNAFWWCSILKSIELKSPNIYIGQEAFAKCNSLERAFISAPLQNIQSLQHQIFCELREGDDSTYYDGFCPNLNIVCLGPSKEQIFPIPKYRNIIQQVLYGTGLHMRLRDTMEVYREEKRCPNCGAHLSKHFLSNYYCPACSKEFKKIFDSEYFIGLPYNLGKEHYQKVIQSNWYQNLQLRGLI